MTEIYGHRWVSSYGTSDKEGTWAKGLVDMTESDLATGYIACIKSGKAWPPSLPEFRSMCRPIAEKRENEAMYRMPPSRQLPHLLSDERRVAGRSAIAEAKAAAKRAQA